MGIKLILSKNYYRAEIKQKLRKNGKKVFALKAFFNFVNFNTKSSQEMRTGLIFVDFRLHCSLVGDREGGCHTEQGNLDSVFPSPLDLLLTVAVVQTVA